MSRSSLDPLKLLAGALRDKRPLVLFAGQTFDPAHSLILEALLRRPASQAPGSGWTTVLASGLSSSDLAWLSERFERTVPADAVLPIFNLAWSAVFTSSIDPSFARRFETRGRQPEAVLSRGTYARVPRSRSRPPIHYLLGKSDETIDDARPPRKRSDLARRISVHATDLANRIGETATARGLVIMAGYSPGTDWMPLDVLLAPLFDHAGPRVLWFGYPGRHDSELASEMIEQGSLVPIPTSLPSALSQLELRGVLDLTGSAAPDEPGVVSIADDAVLDITPALRLRVEASAAIVDDGWTQEPEAIGSSELQEAFRRFHSGLGSFRVLMEGVARGFAVQREFEHVFWTLLRAQLDRFRQANSEDVVILHGQSGTGKTIALARLARRLRCELRLPVVVATNRIPSHADIEAFCQEAEGLGAPATVLLCDSSQAPQRYDDLAAALRSRGRRLLIVGTCYRLEAGVGDGSNRFVEAPATVAASEALAFKELQKSFDLPEPPDSTSTDSIFAMLYRRLPSSRQYLAAGVTSEVRTAESRLRERARSVPRAAVAGLPVIATQLLELGLASATSRLFDDAEELAALGLDAAGRLIDYVMVPGRLNCPVPINLALRALGQTDGLHGSQVSYLLSDLDLFRWDEDGEGSDFLVSPRIQLEADLVCRRRLTADQEIARLIDLITYVRIGVDQRAERSFLLDLLFKIDRNGPRGAAYSAGYLRFADALKQLREQNGISDPDLVLRECVFRRRAVHQLQAQWDASKAEEQLAVLDVARDTIEKTLRHIEAHDGLRISARTKGSLLAERSAIYGFLAVQRAGLGAGQEFWSDYLAARTAGEKAMGLGRHFYPIDIALWTASDVLRLKRGSLSDPQLAEVLADVYATFDFADDIFRVGEGSAPLAHDGSTDSGPDDGRVALDQRAKYLVRRSRTADAIGDTKLADETLSELEGIAPAAATFLVAKRRAGQTYAEVSAFDEDARRRAGEAADYIGDRVAAGVALDERCQRLLLRLRWAHATGDRLMFNHRGRTLGDRKELLGLVDIVSELNAWAGADARSRERFLEAVLCWLLGDTRRASEIWRSLSQDTEYQDRSRVVRWLLATDDNGTVRQFRGRVERRENWRRVRVVGIDTPVNISARDFPNEDLAHGRELRDFGIAFNYVGPIVDPPSRSGPRR